MAPIELHDAIVAQLAGLGVAAPVDLALERPRNPDHGDWAVNCFPLAKGSGYAGPPLAAALADALNQRSARPPGQGRGGRRFPQPPPRTRRGCTTSCGRSSPRASSGYARH